MDNYQPSTPSRLSRCRRSPGHALIAAEALESRFLLSGSPVVTLSIAASGGNWTAFAQIDNNGDNVGLASFDLDVIGSGGLTVTTSAERAPSSHSAGFDTFVSSGTTGVNITAAQSVVAATDTVAEGIGQENSSASPDNQGLTWSTPVIVATGSYSGSLGTLTASEDSADGEFQSLNIVSNGAWVGPGNLATDTVLSGSVTIAPVSTMLAFASEPASITAGNQLPTFVVDVETQTGSIATTDSSQVSLSLAEGPSGFNGVSVAAQNGAATFSGITLNTAGTYLFRATDGTLTMTLSTPFIVSPAAASSLAYEVQPSTVSAGVMISPAISVEVLDPFQNVVTSDSSSVTLSVSNGPGVLSGTVSIPVSNGVATFSDTFLDTAGGYKLLATDVGDSIAPVKSGKFTVNPGTATQFVFNVQPTNLTAGQSFSPAIRVYAEDPFGNVDVSYNRAIDLGGKVVPPNFTFPGQAVIASAGVATFPNVPPFFVSGGYKLKATQSGVTPGKSSKFFVFPGPATQLAFVQQPAIGVAPIVAVEDQYGNLEGSDASLVTLTLKTGPIGGVLGGQTSENATAGDAEFGSLTFSIAGTYRLVASDGNLTQAFSVKFSADAN